MLLELAELAPFKELKFTRFDEAPNRFNVGHICDIILNLIAKKSLRQGGEFY